MTAINTTPEYERDQMALVVAEITSGIKGAMPEEDDYTMADKLINIIEEELRS